MGRQFPTVKAASLTNLGLSGTGTTIQVDEVTINNGDVILLNQQTDLSQNGIYHFNVLNGNWTLVRDALGDSETELNGMVVRVSQGTVYGGAQFHEFMTIGILGVDSIRFERLLTPPSDATLNIDLYGNEILPYAVTVATTSQLNAVYNAGVAGVGATLTGGVNGTINSVSTMGGGFPMVGIDGITWLQVGDLVLVKDQVQNPTTFEDIRYTNGVYKVVDLGSATTPWVLERVDWADEYQEFSNLRLSVQYGTYNADTRFVETYGPSAMNQPKVFSSDPLNIYSGWAHTAETGSASATLPMVIVVQDANGNDEVITHDANTGLAFVPVTISMTNLADYFNLGAVNPVTFDYPNFRDSVPVVDPMPLLQNQFLMGDGLDLALFNLQLAIDQALGHDYPVIGQELPNYTTFVEDFRSMLTNRLRDDLRVNKAKPINEIRDDIYAVLGPTGFGYIASRDDIGIHVLGVDGSDMNWDIYSPNSYQTINGVEMEKLPVGAYTVEFSFVLEKALDTDATAANLQDISLGLAGSELGISFDDNTVKLNSNGTTTATSGGINLKTSFLLNFGFGVDVDQGFFIYQPNDPGSPSQLMSIQVQAAMDGDLSTQGVQTFQQSNDTSTWRFFNAGFVDNMTAGGTRASGFYGQFDFYLNAGSANNGKWVTLDDMRVRDTLGADASTGLISYNLNADAHIDLWVDLQSGNAQGFSLPNVQTRFFYTVRYGTGSSVLAAGYASWKDTITAPGADSSLSSIPTFMYDRANDISGQSYYAFQNMTVDVDGYLQGTLLGTLAQWNEWYAPNLKPIIQFMLQPIPGLSDFSNFTLGSLLGSKFVFFATFINRMSDMLAALTDENYQVGPGAAAVPSWARARKDLGGTANQGFALPNFLLPNLGIKDEKYKTLAKQEIAQSNAEREFQEEAKRLGNININNEDDNSDSSNKGALQKLKDSLSSASEQLSDSAKKFAALRDSAFAEDPSDNWVKKQIKQALQQDDDRHQGGKKQLITGLSGGGFRLDFLKSSTIVDMLLGRNANLLFIEVPRLEVGVAYSRSFPLPPFPPLVATIGASVSIFASFNFGYDTTGFYWSTVNYDGVPTPAFGFEARVTVGGALDLALLEAGIQVFLQVDLTFSWNDLGLHPGDPGYGRLNNSQINYLKNLPDAGAHAGNIFDVTLAATIGITFYVDITIPIPIVGPINVRILEKTFSAQIFSVTFYADRPTAQLGTYDVSTDTLYLNLGQRASDRLFGDLTSWNEDFVLTSLGINPDGTENIHVVAQSLGGLSQDFDEVRKVVAWAGGGVTTIDASALTAAYVNFWGGDGETILYAGAGTLGRNRLQGGSGTGELHGSSYQGTDFYGGSGNTLMYGGLGADNFHSGPASDIMYGVANPSSISNPANYAGNDTFYFSGDWGRDRIMAYGIGNKADFTGVTEDITFDLSSVVQSAEAGKNTVFFAPDAAGHNRIDYWVGGSGNDRFNTYAFTPNQTLHLDGGVGSNFYAVTLGNALTPINGNPGVIAINDSAGLGRMLIKQSFSDPIDYDLHHVNNDGRDDVDQSQVPQPPIKHGEYVTMSGLVGVDLDAGAFTVDIGDGSNPNGWADLGKNATITAGKIVLLSNVEADGLTINSVFDFNLNKNINMRNNSSLVFNIQNLDPEGFSNFVMGVTGGATQPAIYDSAGSQFATSNGHPAPAPLGDGTGTITINTPTGSILNKSLNEYGWIIAKSGTIVLNARDSIGIQAVLDSSSGATIVPADVIRVEAAALSAYARGSSFNTAGINIYSDRDLNVLARGGLNGLETLYGNIDVEMAAGKKFTYNYIDAGNGHNILITADNVDVSPPRTEQVPRIETYQQLVTNVVWINYSFWDLHTINFGFFTWSWWTYDTIQLPILQSYYVTATRTVYDTVTIPASGEIVTAGGNVQFQNVTANYNAKVGDDTTYGLVTSYLNVNKRILDSIQAGANIVVGRSTGSTTKTGLITLLDYSFNDRIVLQGSQIDVSGTAVGGSSASAFQFLTYNNSSGGNGDINLHNTGGLHSGSFNVQAARNVVINTQLSVPNTVSDSEYRFTAGYLTGTGTIQVLQSLSVHGINSAFLFLTAGAISGDLQIDNALTADDRITLSALGGMITKSTGVATALITANELDAQSKNKELLTTQVNKILHANVSGGSVGNEQVVQISEADGVEVDSASTAFGNISITTTTGNLTIGKINANFNSSISAQQYGVTLSAVAGAITGLTPNVGDYNLHGYKLTSTSLNGVNLVTILNQLYLDATGLGDVSFTNLRDASSGNGDLELLHANVAHGSFTLSNLGTVNVDSLTLDGASGHDVQITTATTYHGAIMISALNAGTYGDVTLSADDVIQKTSASSLLTADILNVTAFGRRATNDVPTGNVLDLRMNVSELYAKTYDIGHTVFDVLGGLTIRYADISNGNFQLTAVDDIMLDNSPVAGHPINVVNTPNNDISLTSTTGSILHTAGRLFADQLTVSAYGSITMDTTVGTVIANSLGSGDITIHEFDSAVFQQVTAHQGNINLTTGSINPLTNQIDVGGQTTLGDIDAGSYDVTMTIVGQITMLNSSSRVIGDEFTAEAYADVNLYTNVNTFTFDMGLQGVNPISANVTLAEDDDINVNHINVQDGSLNFTANGQITLQGDVNVSDQTNLTSVTSLIRQTTGRVTTTDLVANSVTGIQLYTATDYLTGIVSGTGAIQIDELDALEINQLQTADGSITLTAGGATLADSVTSQNDAAGNDINIQVTTGDLDIDQVRIGSTLDASMADVILNVLQGGIFKTGSAGVPQIVANHAIMNTTTGIGTSAQPIDLSVNYIQATASQQNGIYLHNLKGAELQSVVAHDGPVVATVDGDLRATLVKTEVDSADNFISFTTTNGGNVLIDTVVAGLLGANPNFTPPQFANVTITSDGNINAVTPTVYAVNIVGQQVELDAQTGVGDVQFPLLTCYSLGVQTTQGNVSVQNNSSSDLHIYKFRSGAGNLTFVQTGGGSVYGTDIFTNQGNIFFDTRGGGLMNLNGVVTDLGNITLQVENGARLLLTNLYSGGDTLLQADKMTLSGPSSVDGTGLLTITPNSPLVTLYLTSSTANDVGNLESPFILEIGNLDRGAIKFVNIRFTASTVVIFMPQDQPLPSSGGGGGSSSNDNSQPQQTPLPPPPTVWGGYTSYNAPVFDLGVAKIFTGSVNFTLTNSSSNSNLSFGEDQFDQFFDDGTGDLLSENSVQQKGDAAVIANGLPELADWDMPTYDVHACNVEVGHSVPKTHHHAQDAKEKIALAAMALPTLVSAKTTVRRFKRKLGKK